MRQVNVIFLAALLLSLVICVIGPLAAAVATGGPWLFLWPLAFWIVRFLAFFVFPAVAIVLMWIKYRKSFGGPLAYVNVVLAVILASTVLGIQSFTKSEARSAFAQQFGSASPAEILNRGSAGQSLPAVPLLDSSGRAVDLRDQIRTARVTLVVFFATYNIPWSDKVKTAREIHRTMAKDGVLVLGINEQESQETINTFIAKQQVDFPIFRDSDGKYLHALGIYGSVERLLVVDRNAEVISPRGSNSESKEGIEEAILAQIKK